MYIFWQFVVVSKKCYVRCVFRLHPTNCDRQVRFVEKCVHMIMHNYKLYICTQFVTAKPIFLSFGYKHSLSHLFSSFVLFLAEKLNPAENSKFFADNSSFCLNSCTAQICAWEPVILSSFFFCFRYTYKKFRVTLLHNYEF